VLGSIPEASRLACKVFGRDPQAGFLSLNCQLQNQGNFNLIARMLESPHRFFLCGLFSSSSACLSG
jgi:hypothetical protein